MNREQFEKLPEIAKRLYSVQFGVPHKENVARYGLSAGLVTQEKIDDFRFVVGAWYAWQKQQKKIDEAVKELSSPTFAHHQATYQIFRSIDILKGG